VGMGKVKYSNGTIEDKKVYVKTIHLLDPFSFVEGDYVDEPIDLPVVSVPKSDKLKKLLDPNNQAYIDVTTMSILGQLKEKNVIPHAVKIYGAVCGIQESYLYNITDEYDTLKKKEWFWESVGISGELIHVTGNPDTILSDETIAEIKKCPFQMKNEYTCDEDVCVLDVSNITVDDIPMEEAEFNFDDASDISSQSSTDEDPTYTISIECKNMPVILLFEEAATGILDDLLEEDASMEESLIADKDDTTDALKVMRVEKEGKWTAWMMQVVCALTQLQALLGLCHNDLHTNNITWTQTPYEYIIYSNSNGDKWKVPTYGKLFKIIDFGRATFRIGKKEFMSDDFFYENEAYGQYNYGPCYNEAHDIIPSNPSFDLCRLSVSMIDSLYNETPCIRGNKRKRKIMNKEGSWIKYYTVSQLYNVLWKWLLNDKRQNVLMDESGNDRFPGFDLYVHIARYVHNAVPKEQLENIPFSVFKENGSDGVDDPLILHSSLYI
jgi:hypothetical protein